MINTKYISALRSKKRFNSNTFIYEKISKTIIDSIDLIKINFENILEFGVNENTTFDYLHKKFRNSNFIRIDSSKNVTPINNEFKFFKQNIGEWNLKNNAFDLIISNCYSFISDSFDNSLKNIKQSLKNDGFFILAIPEKYNLYQLHNSMIKADLETYNGVFQRVNPTYEVEFILSKLKQFQFNGSIVNTDKFIIEYENFNKLMNDVRSMNLSYFHLDKKKKFERSNYFDQVEKNFRNDYFKDNTYPLEFRINIVSAWK